ncbi:CHAT domain-containing protein [Bradyrhizobium sp. STM 3809]|uniref:CHAT domain-containing protein n=1 Tax=Bradyrhizobium sp. STM 3809 TaxID=551936 RepID=UPI001478F333|nr:CHAT domain-containing protein [Bradyrhizobium sp. STM 3809]
MQDRLRALLDVNQRRTEAGNLFLRAEAAKLSGDYQSASVTYRRYIDIAKAVLSDEVVFNTHYPTTPLGLAETVQPIINALLVSADIEYALGRPARAGALREEAASLSFRYLGRKGEVEAKRASAGALLIEGRFNEAYVALVEARDDSIANDDPLAVARVALDLADMLHWLGDVRRADEEVDHARAVIEPIVGKQPVTRFDLIKAIGSSITSIMSGKGDPGTATKAVKLYRAYTEIIYYRGLILKALRQWAEAAACFEKVKPEYRSLGSGEAIEYQLVQIDLGQGRYQEALQRANAIESAFEKGAFRPKRPVLLRTMAECHLGLGHLDECFRLLSDAIKDLQDPHLDPDARWRVYGVLARAAARAGDDEGMLRGYRDAIATIDSLRRAPLGYRLDSTYLEDKQELYAAAIEGAARTDHAADCCAFIESIKSRTLRVVLSMPPGTTSEESPGAARFHAVSRELDGIDYKRWRGDDVRSLRQKAKDLRAERVQLLEEVRVSDPRWRRLTVPITLDQQAVLRQLSQRRQAALTLFYDPPALVCAALWEGKLRCARLQIASKVMDCLATYQANLLKARPDVELHDFSSRLAVTASDLIPAELLDVVTRAESLVIVPHGVLHLLPWACLLHQGHRLFEYLPVSVLPSLGLLMQRASLSRPATVGLLGVAVYPDLPRLAPLPSAVDELAAIRDAYHTAGIPVRMSPAGHQDTTSDYRDRCRGLSGQGHVLHVSCHGTMDTAEPMRSGLWLADGKLDAVAIAETPTPFEEVVLSACYTGWRPTEVDDIQLNGDDILGIPAAFLESGASSVLLSVTQAQGQAAQALTAHYHRRRAAGDLPLRAARAAQLHMLSTAIAPGAWTGFTLYGCQ